MEPLTTSTFALPAALAAKADPALIAADEQHFATLTASLAESIAELSAGSTPNAGHPAAPARPRSTATWRSTA